MVDLKGYADVLGGVPSIPAAGLGAGGDLLPLLGAVGTFF
jgi:hypothetical protein